MEPEYEVESVRDLLMEDDLATGRKVRQKSAMKHLAQVFYMKRVKI